ANPTPPENQPGNQDTQAQETGHLNPDAVVGKGEGIEHTLIRQIENNPKLAHDLGYTGEDSDTESSRRFAEVKSHVLAIKHGYVDMEGHEVRVSEAGKVAYELKMENGEPAINERAAGTGEILE